jgi:hypothetical protein
MKNDAILKILIKASSLNKNQLKQIKDSLLKTAKISDNMDYFDGLFFREALDSSIRLIITRLTSRLDIYPCKDLWRLLPLASDNSANRELYEWITSNISTEHLTSEEYSIDTREELHMFLFISNKLS